MGAGVSGVHALGVAAPDVAPVVLTRSSGRLSEAGQPRVSEDRHGLPHELCASLIEVYRPGPGEAVSADQHGRIGLFASNVRGEPDVGEGLMDRNVLGRGASRLHGGMARSTLLVAKQGGQLSNVP
jgi:hypothetical protein